MVTAIITAGGVGSRMNNNIPKQFIPIDNIPIILYTLKIFQDNTNIDKIVVACIPDWQPILRAYIEEFGITKIDKIVDGGATGFESIYNCFCKIKNNDNDIIIIHDGNRPLISDDIIDSNINEMKNNKATTTYIDIHDGIVNVDASLNIVKSDLRREYIKSTQTPHCFKYVVLKDIFEKTKDMSKYISLADAAVNYGYYVKLVKGSEINFKITTQNDLEMFKVLKKVKMK